MNTYIWHLQGMMALPAAAAEVASFESGTISFRLTRPFNQANHLYPYCNFNYCIRIIL